MIQVTCAQCGQNYPAGAGHQCEAEGETTPPANDLSPLEVARLLKEAEKRRLRRQPYMREYMRKRRAAKKAESP